MVFRSLWIILRALENVIGVGSEQNQPAAEVEEVIEYDRCNRKVVNRLIVSYVYKDLLRTSTMDPSAPAASYPESNNIEAS